MRRAAPNQQYDRGRMTDSLMQRIAAALTKIAADHRMPDFIEEGTVANIATTTDGKVRMTLFLSAADDATLARDLRQGIEAVEGVQSVIVDVRDASEKKRGSAPASATSIASAIASASQQPARAPQPAATAAASSPPPPTGRRSLNVIEPPRAAPARPQAPTPQRQPNLGSVIAISSGKGGVGKSTVTTNIAVALAKLGYSVGLMDADIYGPNIPRMMGVNSPPPVEKQRIIPLEAHGVKIMSLGFLVERDQPAIWRGPIVMKIITQFLRDVEWGQLDFLLVDMPPGTGDAQLSLVQATMVGGAVIVTTPQEVATGDALRGAKMFERVGVPVLGVVENMSWFECGKCGEREYLFGKGGGATLALELSLPLLGEVPLYPAVLRGGETGTPIVISEPDSSASRVLLQIADQIAARASGGRARQ
jgi:ATP-binding protein involved in chromosome partitioning